MIDPLSVSTYSLIREMFSIFPKRLFIYLFMFLLMLSLVRRKNFVSYTQRLSLNSMVRFNFLGRLENDFLSNPIQFVHYKFCLLLINVMLLLDTIQKNDGTIFLLCLKLHLIVKIIHWIKSLYAYFTVSIPITIGQLYTMFPLFYQILLLPDEPPNLFPTT